MRIVVEDYHSNLILFNKIFNAFNVLALHFVCYVTLICITNKYVVLLNVMSIIVLITMYSVYCSNESINLPCIDSNTHPIYLVTYWYRWIMNTSIYNKTYL